MATNKQQASTDDLGGLETIAPTEQAVTVDGVPCRVSRLRMRELLKLVRVLTTGLGDAMSALDFNADKDAFAQQLMSAAIVGIPHAEDEFVELVQAVVVPQDPRRADEVRDALHNPDLDVVIDAVGVVIDQEADAFQSLLGKVQNLAGHAAALRDKTNS